MTHPSLNAEIDMTALKRVPGFQRESAGLEWTILRRLPICALIGTIVLIVGMFCASLLLGGDATNAKLIVITHIVLASIRLLHWIVVFTTALLCVIVLIAKGPAYVADAYPPIDSDRPSR